MIKIAVTNKTNVIEMSVDITHLEGASILRKTSSATWGDIIEQGVHHPLLYCVKTPGETGVTVSPHRHQQYGPPLAFALTLTVTSTEVNFLPCLCKT